MSSDTPTPQPPADGEPVYADRVYRSAGGVAGGVLLLALALWLGIDALVRGDSRVRLLAASALLWVVPLVFGYAVRPAVFAGREKLRVRNPLRTVTAPWGAVDGLRAGMSNELLAGDAKYQLWAIPVSLRGRKKAMRKHERARATGPLGGGPGSATHEPALAVAEDHRSAGDKSMNELRDLMETNGGRPAAQGPVTVTWAWELIAPFAVGLVAFVIVVAVG
ncbi:hypothetical protein SRB5_60890 [Streptomyces sp. RB5]|uniref:Low molecular weight protein antigen 6 PH domain-containing protein n=1 Tax=Streptomyces smaragdinus TaxID=2585196 RepID=A0A7K0CQY5_9ACTN|nr:PH domain-containing protein [Streptomyces smaragdinus]MQY15897.1 hypothetical protein [Streptomyces smaragdinus]